MNEPGAVVAGSDLPSAAEAVNLVGGSIDTDPETEMPMPGETSRTDLPITPGLKEQADRRLARIEGQVRGLRKMIAEDRYCVDVLQQIASTHEALRGVGKLMMQKYLENCATEGIRSEDPEERAETYEELRKVIYRFVR
jgi:DNA-binding FrmR family transcriptional regulator